ncbi:hypothetical protein DAEQUDRAFT_279434 [Daedalea quercina L-15889]|uniref:Uncharacterized protein n=1 Tax=Daedalea quercina L-15889 TaxID=1314783 RepID=A0A165Q8D7_9APHY|nr:hypothetical protein DAEQUDRAFT_279434 [Daedalea quercina L-15889]
MTHVGLSFDFDHDAATVRVVDCPWNRVARLVWRIAWLTTDECRIIVALVGDPCCVRFTAHATQQPLVNAGNDSTPPELMAVARREDGRRDWSSLFPALSGEVAPSSRLVPPRFVFRGGSVKSQGEFHVFSTFVCGRGLRTGNLFLTHLGASAAQAPCCTIIAVYSDCPVFPV